MHVRFCHGITARQHHRSEAHGIAERAVRPVKEGASAVLSQSGLDERWWSDSVESCCYLRNVQDLLEEGKTPYERRFGEPFKGPIIPFGAMVEHHPSSPKDQMRIYQFGKKVLPGIFLGYELIAGGISQGDILIPDLEELEILDASNIYPRRINAKEVLITQKEDEFLFPIADGTAKLSGRDCEFREPTLRREPTVRSEDLSGEIQGESEESQPAEPTDDAKAWRDFFWSIKMTSSIVITMNLEFNSLCRRRKHSLIPLKYIDVTRSTHTRSGSVTRKED